MDVGPKTSLHKIPTSDLTRQELKYNYSNVELLAEGRKAKVYSARHHKTDTNLVLKCIDKESTNKMDFFREFHYTYFLSPHPNIVNSFDVAFDTRKSFVFVQELAAEGDLLKAIKNKSLTEEQSKNVAKQISSALEFIHSKDLVHRDICLENIFVYDKDFSRVKIGDFGQTKITDTLVNKGDIRLQWAPPEISQAVENEKYHLATNQDSWQLGILIFVCMTGFFPWARADITDPRYSEWLAWHKKKIPKIPQNFKYFSNRLLRLFKRLLDPKPESRYCVKEVTKYLDDSWVVEGSGEIEIFYDEDLSVNTIINKPMKKLSKGTTTRSSTDLYGSTNSLGIINKPLNKLSGCSSTQSTTNLYGSSSSIGVKRSDSRSSPRRNSLGTRRSSIQRTSSSSSIKLL